MNEEDGREPTRTELKLIQRVFQVSTTPEAIWDLINNELNSAYDLVKCSENEFLDRFSKVLGGAESTRKIYLHARKINNDT